MALSPLRGFASTKQYPESGERGWVFYPPPGLLGGPCGPSILLFALSSSSFSTASCCNSPFEGKADLFQWAVIEASCGYRNSTGTNTPSVHLCNTIGEFPSRKHTGFHPGSEWICWVSHSSEHWVLAVSSDESMLHFQPFFLSEQQLLVHFLRMWHKCNFIHSDSKHPQLKTIAWIKFFST